MNTRAVVSRPDDLPASGPAAAGRPWGLWARQVLAVARLEVRKSFLSKRVLPVLVLAGLPVVPFAARAVFAPFEDDPAQLSQAITIYGALFQTFMLRFCFYFGCVAIFANLFRGEVLDRTLHYHFLAPIRRELLVAGKYVSGLAGACAAFGATTVLTVLLLYVPTGKARAIDHLLHGPGLSHLFWYLVVTVMACVGYGAVFLLVGLVFKNPVVPAVLILGWESIIFLLPPLLKKISVAYYLQSLCPFQLNQEKIAILAEPSPPWQAIPGILAVTVVLLVLAARRIRRYEVSYGVE